MVLTQGIVEALARVLGATNEGLTNAEIDRLLLECRIVDDYGGGTKWKRLSHVLWNQLVRDRSDEPVLRFVRHALEPARSLKNPERHAHWVSELTKVLSFVGMIVTSAGNVELISSRSETINDAIRRAEALKESLISREVHSRVLHYCKAELLACDYFHAAHESVKGVFDRVREISCIDEDGHKLVDSAFSQGSEVVPVLIINLYQTQSERAEQNGFGNLLKGVYGMFRNPTAHEPRVKWEMSRKDAEDILSLVSLIHRRLDSTQRVR